MKKSKLVIPLVIGIPFILVLAWFIVPALRLTVMNYRLEHAGSAERVELVSRELIKDGSTTAMNALASYATQHDLAAFDRVHRVFIIHDPSNGLIHANTHILRKNYTNQGREPTEKLYESI